MKPIDPRRWARPGDLLRSTRDILTEDEDLLPYETLALVVEVGPPSVEFIDWLNMKILVVGRLCEVWASRNCWEHIDDHI